MTEFSKTSRGSAASSLDDPQEVESRRSFDRLVDKAFRLLVWFDRPANYIAVIGGVAFLIAGRIAWWAFFDVRGL